MILNIWLFYLRFLEIVSGYDGGSQTMELSHKHSNHWTTGGNEII